MPWLTTKGPPRDASPLRTDGEDRMPRHRDQRISARFRPSLDGAKLPLEPRLLLSRMTPQLRIAQLREARLERLQAQKVAVTSGTKHAPPITPRSGVDSDGVPQSPKPYVQTGVVSSGRGAAMIDVDGEFYVAHMSGGGTVRAKSAPDGRVDLTVYGSRPNSVLSIDPETPTRGQNDAHQFAAGTAYQDGLLHVRNITVVNGKISQIVGYRTADVSGAITVRGQNIPQPSVSRIAFYALRPGASIDVVGDLDTLDIIDTIALDGGPGIRVSRDLNWFNTGSSVILVNGASIQVGRDIGLVAQAAKGTGPAGQGGLIPGDLIIGNASTITVGRFVDAPIIVQGSSLGIANVPANVAAAISVLGVRA